MKYFNIAVLSATFQNQEVLEWNREKVTEFITFKDSSKKKYSDRETFQGIFIFLLLLSDFNWVTHSLTMIYSTAFMLEKERSAHFTGVQSGRGFETANAWRERERGWEKCFLTRGRFQKWLPVSYLYLKGIICTFNSPSKYNRLIIPH